VTTTGAGRSVDLLPGEGFERNLCMRSLSRSGRWQRLGNRGKGYAECAARLADHLVRKAPIVEAVGQQVRSDARSENRCPE